MTPRRLVVRDEGARQVALRVLGHCVDEINRVYKVVRHAWERSQGCMWCGG
jgi:hypothetical protein